MNSFRPDIIIEVTSTCDRSCPGCYAPNFLVKKDPLTVFQERPEFFISLERIKKILEELFISNGNVVQSISLRGGEPSLHPELPNIIKVVRPYSIELFIETHGRWLLSLEESDYYNELAKICAQANATLKVSFDKMHKLSSEQIKSIIDQAKTLGINYFLAITESTIDDFNETISKIPFVDREKILFQRKAHYSEQLMTPSMAIIDVSGKIKGQLTSQLRSQHEAMV